MRRCFWLCCARGSPAASSVVAADLSRSSSKHVDLYARCVDPQLPSSDLVQHSSALLPYIKSGQVALDQKVKLLTVLAARAVRNEPIVQQCLWDTFKAPLPATADSSTPSLQAAALAELSAHTARAFRVMAEQRFLNDPQLTAIALGRCVELAPHLTLKAVSEVYRGLGAVDHSSFTTAEAALYDCGLTERMTVKEFYERDSAPDADTLRHQPNLIDVLCGELEMQLRHCAARVHGDASADGGCGGGTTLVPLLAQSTDTPEAPDAQTLLAILQALSTVGVMHGATLDSIGALLSRCRGDAPAGFFIRALDHATQVAERVVDPLMYEEAAAVKDARRRLAVRLSEEVCRMPNAAGYLRHHPQELLLLRRLFEREAATSPLPPALWEMVRGIRVAHRHTAAPSQKTTRPTGKLFAKELAVKVKPISVDNSEAERFVPPEFKTWRSPAATPRGGHRQSGRTPRRVGFGTQRISKNYIKNKRKKYCPAVF